MFGRSLFEILLKTFSENRWLLGNFKFYVFKKCKFFDVENDLKRNMFSIIFKKLRTFFENNINFY